MFKNSFPSLYMLFFKIKHNLLLGYRHKNRIFGLVSNLKGWVYNCGDGHKKDFWGKFAEIQKGALAFAGAAGGKGRRKRKAHWCP